MAETGEIEVGRMTSVQLLEEGNALSSVPVDNDRLSAIENELRDRFWCDPCKAWWSERARGRPACARYSGKRGEAICAMRSWPELAGFVR